MTQTLLSRTHHAPRPDLSVFPEMALSLGRVHEVCGTARRTLALMVAGRIKGPILWITSSHPPERINPDGARAYAPVSEIMTVNARRPEHLLWCMEETLRAGCVGLVVTDLDTPLALTPVRRLHLAAEAGAEAGYGLPLGIVLTPGAGGSAGVESRWSLEPRHRPDRLQWQLDRLRARTAPVKSWSLVETPKGLVQGLPEALKIAA